ncbi:MAG: hypothetical protein IJI67_06180 [Clostridia bacterium]|nr:hypothetical protein [Clostridia bacterium]
MDLSNEKIQEFMKKLLYSRMRILNNNGFYGLLLMHMVFSLDEKTPTACTNGMRIAFNPDFLDRLSDKELDYILMHEILHVVLQHCFRTGERKSEKFNIACDIVVNSNILLSNDMDLGSITIKGEGPGMHLAPNGKEGYEYTVEQLYALLPEIIPGEPVEMPGDTASGYNARSDDEAEDSAGDDTEGGGDDENDENGGSGSGKGGSGGNSGDGEGGGDGSENSGDGDDAGGGGKSQFKKGRAKKEQRKAKSSTKGSWDDHTQWGMLEEDDILRDVWVKHFEDACEAITIRDPSNSRGLMPAFAERLFKELRKPQTDWRTILNEFVQEEICDYSFAPPDRRFDESPFFLPDFNEKEELVKDILFMIDTSASMSDDMITAAYSEIKGAIDQFNGKLKGWLGFFDAAIIEPQPFADEEEFKVIKAAGGGGTDFQIILEYVQQHMQENPPASIIILTDGFAPFPKEELANGIPVLWLLNNEEVNPPWGKVARIKV